MAPRRWLLAFLSLGSLVVLAYAGVLYAFSTPVTDAMEQEALLPGRDEPRQGTRALVLPGLDLARLPTYVDGRDGFADRPGALLLVAEEPSDFPASTSDGRLVRALARVVPDANGTYPNATLSLVNVPTKVGDNATVTNLTLDVHALAGGGTGFLVRADAGGEPFFVSDPDVVGQVARFEPSMDVLVLVMLGAAGFVLPLVALILTHRPSGRRGIGDVVCPECRGPMSANADFCTRCGAWRKGRGPDA